MSERFQKLEEYKKSINSIINLLNSDDGLTKMFPFLATDQYKNEKSIIDNTNVFFNDMNNSFKLVLRLTPNLDESCKITARSQIPILYDTCNDVVISYTLIIRYLIEYNIIYPNNIEEGYIYRMIDSFKKHSYLFHFNSYIDKVAINQMEYVAKGYENYVFSNNMEIIKEELNDIKSKFNNYHEIEDITNENKIIKEEIDKRVRDLDDEINKIHDEKIKQIDDILQEKEDSINALRDYLDNLGNNYNFAGLNKAYHDFYKSKNIERWVSLIILFILGASCFLPIGYKLITEKANKITDVNIIHYVSFSVLTIIALYFFRVSLQNYNSIKAELTQIKLRMNLCMFVDNYSDFSKRKDNREALEKFENIIFSNIQMNENKIPSTFDGLEQLASLIESINRRNK